METNYEAISSEIVKANDFVVKFDGLCTSLLDVLQTKVDDVIKKVT